MLRHVRAVFAHKRTSPGPAGVIPPGSSQPREGGSAALPKYLGLGPMAPAGHGASTVPAACVYPSWGSAGPHQPCSGQ